MKKNILLILSLLLIFPLSAKSNKYYKNEKLINTMYVNSLEGLKVRDTPTLSGKRICGLVNALPVKVVEIGNETEIDGIKDNWVKILIPAYEWKSENPEYGWVFGGYLSEQKIPYNLNSIIDINNLLMSKIWKEENGPYVRTFDHDGIFAIYRLAAGGGETGNYYLKDQNTLVLKGKFYDEYGASEEYTVSLKLKIINENRIQIDGKDCIPFITLDSDLFDLRDDIYGDYCGKSIYEVIFLNNQYNHIYTEEEKNQIADKLIKFGLDASGTKYEKAYDVYWSSIIK
ncbi:MAG: SH3 domain-containing protein [Treponema sp.]|nr:SH3 domain-containing protein [Treponema sp.]